MDFVYELHKTMLQEKLILAYEGEFTQEVTKSILAMTERNMDSFGEDSGVKRKVFNVMVECLQNISKHADNLDPESGAKNNALFMIGKDEHHYFITSGNPVFTEKVPEINRKLSGINDLDKDGLKALYKEIITGSPGLSEKGGAGLGFVDMARKSGNKLQFEFETIDGRLSFFSLKNTVSRVNTKE